MKLAIVIFLTAAVTGCAGQTGTLPTLDGTQRVPINKQVPTMTAPEATNNQQESNHVRK
ncbi:type IV secretion system protein VirB7 [Methylomonas sp. ZR1]|uniref:type IV secretion system protein VirB7 n=1 Tax=Methylomonas sp. ZR1 TaxID=1797072 RepID=UPI001491185C|nr:type IV secretion system protein VirB7 [Methylomonas sp. ZR1]